MIEASSSGGNPPGESRRRASRRLVWAWLVGTLVLLIAGVRSTRIPSIGAAFRFPETPIDLTSQRHAEFWVFLKEARKNVPEGATYTIVAGTPDEDMYLFMFSLGIFEKHRAIPSTYWGFPQGQGRRAEYVLAFERNLSAAKDLLPIVRIGEGGVYRRQRCD